MNQKRLVTVGAAVLAISAVFLAGLIFFRLPAAYQQGTGNILNSVQQQQSATTQSVTTTVAAVVTPAPAPTASTEVMAWVYPGAPSCNAKAEFSDGRSIQVIKSEYFTVDGSGNLVLLTASTAGCNGYSVANLASAKASSQRQYATVSSAYSGSMDIFLTNANANNVAVDTLVKFTVDNGIEGIELDFEDFGSWSASSYASYKQFVTKLGNALHAKNKKLMIDGPAIANAGEQSWFLWRYEDFANLPVDKIVVMSYDHQFDHGAGTPVAPLSWIKDVAKFTLSKYPYPDKLTMGIPSYGYRGTANTYSIRILTYTQISKEPGFAKAKRDAASQEMTWRQGRNVYFYQDAESMRQKLKAINDAGINSVSVWHLGGNRWFTN